MKPALALTLSILSLGVVSLANAADSEPKGNSFTDQFSVSGSVGVTSDYRFRGVTQNDENPAIQAGLQVSHESGAYVGLWGSPVDFNDGDEANTEFDLMAGYAYEADAWSADVRYTYYAYPGASSALNYNYSEFQFEGGYDFSVLKLSGVFAYSPDFFGDSGDAEYLQAKLDVPLPYGFAAHAYLGKQYVDDNVAYGLPDARDWNLGVTYSYASVDLDLSYIDTDMDKTECPDGCSGTIVATLTYNF